jgi:hypothetical protein
MSRDRIIARRRGRLALPSPFNSSKIGAVNRRRLFLVVVLVYLGLDLCLADMPGAFVFDADGSVDSISLVRARPDARVVAVPAPSPAESLPLRPQTGSEVRPRPASTAGRPAPRVASQCLPRAACASSSLSEDPH